jgi:arginine deiminase
MVPSMMEQLLFDDILYGERAREEHGMFRRVLQLLGVEVVEAIDLLEATLRSDEARDWLVSVLLEDLPHHLREAMHETDPGRLARGLVRGVRREGAHHGVELSDLFDLAPLPNWCFQRDPQVVLGDGVVFCAMASEARHRESMIARLLFRFHPDLVGASVVFDPLRAERDQTLFTGLHAPVFEGGDVLVMSPDVIVIGRSERTNRTAIQHLARALARRDGSPRWLLSLGLPRRRAYMHLDTVLTPVDSDACLVYPPVITDAGRETAEVWTYDLHSDNPDEPSSGPNLLDSLRALGIDLEPIPCGGADRVSQQREQWTDGANALALAPGLIMLYDRNIATAEELDRRGFRVVAARDLLLGREEIETESAGRVCVLIPSHEISRARGGPHCLTHPLIRDDAP